MQLSRWQLALVFGLLVSVLFRFVIALYPQETIIQHVVYLRPLTAIPFYKHPQSQPQDLWQKLDISAASAYVLDLASGTLLYEKDAQLALYPASTLKLMTALVAVEQYDLDELVAVNLPETVLGTQLGLQSGQQFLVKDLLAALLVSSANDAAYALANYDPQGITSFIDKMNIKAQQLHLQQSYFVNPAGLDEEQQLSSARDLSIMARELLKNEFLANLVQQQQLSIELINPTDLTWPSTYQLINTNQLLGVLPGVIGVKTGTTDLAGEVLVTLVERQGQQILICLMNSQDRYLDTEKIIAWVFNNYQFIKPNLFQSGLSF